MQYGIRFLMVAFVSFATIATWVAPCSTASAQDIETKNLALRIEVRPFETLTVTDHQFLVGDKNGMTYPIAGELRIPQRAPGRLPAVIQIHGSGGINAGVEAWSRLLNQMGIATFLVDSFSGRGLVNVGPDQAVLGGFNMIIDAYRAHDVLALHPRIDSTRIAVIGSSRGAKTALYSSLRRFQRVWGHGLDFAAYISLYTPCDRPEVLDQTDVSDNPIRMFHGIADDQVPVAACRALVQRLKDAGKDIQLTEFPDTWHQFDNPLLSPQPRVAANSQTVRNCTLIEKPRGIIINAETKQTFTYDDPCVERNPHFAFNAEATARTHKAVAELLRSVFKLK